MTLYVSGVSQGYKIATVRSTDTDADGRTESGDQSGACDLNYNYNFTDDGDYIANHVEHWHRHALHGDLVQRTDLADSLSSGIGTIGAGSIGWSPNGRHLVYSVHDHEFTSGGGALCSIYLIPSDPADGSTPLRFTAPVDSSDYDASWSPLGDEIIFHRRDVVIYRKGVPWGNDTALKLVYKHPSDRFLTYTSISPDADSVAFTMQGDQGYYNIFTIPITGGSARPLTNGSGIEDSYARWSPDGDSLVFQRLTYGVTEVPLLKVATGGGPTVLYYTPPTGERAIQSAYSPDGLVITAAVGPSSGLLATTLEAKQYQSLKAIKSNYPSYTASFALFPTLSPDGTRLALTAKDPGFAEALSSELWAARQNMNLPPRITSVGGTSVADTAVSVVLTATVEDTTCFSVAFTDPESDAVTDAAYFLQSWMTYDGENGELCVVPPSGTQGKTYKIPISAMTESGGTDKVIAVVQVVSSARPASTTESESLAPIQFGPLGPNPTSDGFAFATPALSGQVARLSVFDVSGRRVNLVERPAGEVLHWEATTDAGRRVEPGIYLYRVELGGLRRDGKVVVLR